MKKLSGAEVRETYLKWFEERGHQRLPSDSLVPSNDPTLLFTGAGMNQFKDMFLGKGSLPYTRVTTSQKCMRVPDLENVGLTAGHHTFFEMLGNFSFGDYFKSDCIPWVFGFYTEALGLPREQLVVTVYSDDDEAYGIWQEATGLPAERIYRFGEKENFWPASAPSKGPNGPCGPCSEVYFDWNPDEPLPSPEGLEELPTPRFVEIGNCVFTQFDRQEDGSLPPLPQRNIDVGLGLERTTAVLQGVRSNFDTDIFQGYLQFIAERAGKRYGENARDDVHMRRIADHARAVSFCIADGVLPSNEGRGYVLRKILRRACRSGYELGLEQPFLHELTGLVGQQMGEAYGELLEHRKQIAALTLQEEKGFRQIYTAGVARFEAWFEQATKQSEQGQSDWPRVEVEERGSLPMIPGSGTAVFELHDTFGFPADISRSLLYDRGFAIDEEGFEGAMEAQRRRARDHSQLSGEVFAGGFVSELKAAKLPVTEFLGYESCQSQARVLALAEGEQRQARLSAGASGQERVLVVDRSPFYAESGGQVGDTGTWRSNAASSRPAKGRILGCSKQDEYWLHQLLIEEGELAEGEELSLCVDLERRRAIERNHTATHLLHQALKDVLGEHVAQAGSLVAPDRLRFDFTHGERLSPEQLREVERIVSREIMAATQLSPLQMSLSEAKGAGFTALFGEKYGAEVRTLAIGEYSKELCGGTHVANTGQIGPFRIVTETSVAAGVRRIEALTGVEALEHRQKESATLDSLAELLKSPREEIESRAQGLQQEIKKLRKELQQAARSGAKDLLGELEAKLGKGLGDYAEGRFLAAAVEGAGQKQLLDLLDRLRKKYPSFAGLLIGIEEGGKKGLPVVAAVTKDLHGSGLAAGKLVQAATKLLGGGGGGRAELAQGKGKDRAQVEAAVQSARESLVAALGEA
ncbi:MAG: alanine--tRNA ligase [Planctomycetota bacterium]|nr:MAG: alanine--tRNA ligase [Planctomycetota bacterium]